MAEGVSQISIESMVEDVLQQHGKRTFEEASLRRDDAARWLRKMVGVVLGKDLPAEPSEENFRLGVRSGIILCSALNKVQPGSVPKIVHASSDIVIGPNGAVLNQNVKNFLEVIEKMEIPTFEASDLEKGGDTSRIVDCVLALKSYHEWKQCGANGQWKFEDDVNSPMERKKHVRKGSDMLLGFMSRSSPAGDNLLSEDNLYNSPVSRDGGVSHNLHKLVYDLLADRSREDMTLVVEHMLWKLMEEFELKLAATQNEQIRMVSHDKDIPILDKTLEIEAPQISTASEDKIVPSCSMTDETEIRTAPQGDNLYQITTAPRGENVYQITTASPGENVDQITTASQGENVTSSPKTVQPEVNVMKPMSGFEKKPCYSEPKGHSLKCQNLVQRQQRSIQELKKALHSTKEEMQIFQMKYQEQVEDLGKHLNHLAHAASGYRKVMEENRKLYNQVQDLKGNIRVYLRVRPFLPGQANGSSIINDIEDRTITLLTPSKNGKVKKPFTFNRVFGPSSSQEEVFVDMQPLVRSVLDGYNVCIFAYGQTGSGKTYTMTGPKELTQESLGVNYRALNDLFLISEERKDTISYEISVQMIEIYNEQVRDLLASDGATKRLEIRNNSANGINVPNANLVPVKSPPDVINLMNLGHKNRAVGFTNMNDRSSRSHSCLTVHVQGRDLTSGTILHGSMHLVDLAGSERADKTDAAGDRLKEAQHINRSLSALGDVISSLSHKQSHVPYRNSKLTQLLQDSLGGQAKTLMFVHMSPEPDALGETLSTLKFAERVSSVELGAAKTNKEGAEVKELKEQICALKAALARKEGEELGSLQDFSVASSPDTWAVRSYESSPSSWNDNGDAFKTEEASTSTSRSQSLDSQDVYFNSPWPARSSPEMMKEVKGHLQSPKAIHQTTNDLDELENATGDSSEQGNQQRPQLSRSTNTPNVAESKIRKLVSKPAKSQERSSIPQPTKKAASNGNSSPTLNKTARLPAAPAVGKRKPVIKGK